MDDMKTLLANEGIRSLIHKEIKNPIRFLEDAFNETKSLFLSELKKSKQTNSCFEQDIAKCILLIQGMSDRLNSLNKQQASNKEDISSRVPKDWVEKELIKNNERIAKILSDTAEYRKMNDNRWRTSQGKIMDVFEKERLYDLDVQIIKDSLVKCQKDLNQMKVSESERRLLDNKSQEDFNISSKRLLDMIHFNVEEQNKKIDRMYEMVQKSSKRLKQDSVDLSKDINEQFDFFEKDFEKIIEDIKHKRKNVDEELDRLDQQVQRSMQAGKSNKELDDFMKQVSYNARQIEKIQKSLEGE